jgi:hypothetical protein
MNKKTQSNLEKDGFRVGDAKDFVGEVLGGLQDMEPEELMSEATLGVELSTPRDRAAITECLRRLKGYKAIKAKLTHYSMNCQLCNPDEVLAAEKEG